MTVDTVLPTIAIASDKSKLKAGETATLTFTLSEGTSNFVANDVTVSGGALSAFAGKGTSYTAMFTPSANIADIASVSVESGKFTDAAGNENQDGLDVNNAVNMTVDTIRPTVFIVSDQLELNAAETATLTFTLSESARDFVASDIVVTGGTLSGFGGTGASYTATFKPKVSSTANGVVSVASNKFTDAAGNTNSASSNTLTLAVDTVPPSIAITTNSTSLRSNESARITFKLSEISTDFGEDDLTVSNGSISAFAGSGLLYTATFTPTTDVIADGFVSVMNGTFSDRTGNFNIDGAELNNAAKLSARLGLSIAAPENKLGVTTVKVVDALLGNAPTFALSGADAALFKLSTAGVLTFGSSKDFEKPVDKNVDGKYEATVTITNSKTGYKVIRDLTVEVTFVPLLGTEGNDKITGTSGIDTLDGLIGDDILTGGQGRDTFLVSSGKDSIVDFNLLTPGEKGSEILKVSYGAIASAALKAPWVATADSVNLGTANLNTPGLSVDLSSITLGGGWNVRNTGQATTIKGSQFSDVLIGGTGKDTLSGGDGDDLLIGGKGGDVLSGGPGSDTFRFGGDSSTDLLTDFEPGVDRIELDSALFKALLIGTLADDQFLLGTKALTLTQRVFYDQTKGALYYDADGSGKGAAILIGILNNKAALDYTDFLIC
jgi:Ca2+-binding RTX toxin-like protein